MSEGLRSAVLPSVQVAAIAVGGCQLNQGVGGVGFSGKDFFTDRNGFLKQNVRFVELLLSGKYGGE